MIEAGELRPDAPLRKACEKAKSAVAIACYADTERDLAKLIDDELRASNLTIAPDARTALTSLLGGDRQASRNEIRKVALYAHGQREVTLDDVVAIVTDASGLALDPIVDSAFAGRAADVETAFAKAMAAGIYPGMIIMSAQRVRRRRCTRHGCPSKRAAANSKRSTADFPRLHFSRKTLVETALRNTSVERMGRVMAQLADAAFDMRKQSSLAEVIAQRALLAIAGKRAAKGVRSLRDIPCNYLVIARSTCDEAIQSCLLPLIASLRSQ